MAINTLQVASRGRLRTSTTNGVLVLAIAGLLGFTSSFPTQYSGFRVQSTGSMIELCLVAEADAATGMGGVPKIRKDGITYAMYLVETADGNASPVRIKTTTGTKSVRLKT